MKDTNYAFCVARIRALENKLLTGQDITALINQKGYDSAVDFLAQKGYQCERKELDAIIKSESDELQKLLAEVVPDKKELDALYLINDYFNIKVLVKCAVASVNPEKHLVQPSSIKLSPEVSEELFASIKNDAYRDLALKAYDIALKTGNGKFCDSMIDKAAVDNLARIAKNKKSGLIGEICALFADTANIKVAFRCVETNQDSAFLSQSIGDCCYLNKEKLIEKALLGYDELIEYLKTTKYEAGVLLYSEKPSDFEKWCDDELINKTKASVYTSFGIDPVVSYYYRKNLEIKTVRMILNALKSDTDKNIIRERVRSLYA